MKLKKISILTSLVLLASSQAYSHGYVSNPASRVLLCKEGKNKDCGSRAQYEPQSIEQADGLFNTGALDGNMGSADVSGFGELDEQQQGRWAKIVARPGQPLKITWKFTANHKSKHFKFYITKQNWDPNKLLTRADFEEQPLNCYDPQPAWTAPDQPNFNGQTFTCTMPNRTGYQIIMAEWDVFDTGASFYNLIDLDFTNKGNVGDIILPNGDTDDSGSDDSGSTTKIPQYDQNTAYDTPGTEVVYDGKVYVNKWWTKGDIPDAKAYDAWEYVRDYKDENNNPNDNFPVEATKFVINPADVHQGDKIILQLSEEGNMIDIPLIDVPKDMSSNDLLLALAAKINEISLQQLDHRIMAGVKNDSGKVVPNGNSLYIYQIADKPYEMIGFYHQIADHNLKNELHLMDFKDNYEIDANGTLNLNAKIMSHSSATVTVAVTLLDKDGNQVFRKDDIKIQPMDTYDLAEKIDDLQAGKYTLVVSSSLTGAKAWQKTMDIEIAKSGSSDDNPPVNKDVDVTIESSVPYYQIKADDSAIGRTWTTNVGVTNLANYQITIAPWNKTLLASGNDSSTYVKCPLPNNNQSSITYLVSGDLNSISCKIK